MALGWMLGCQVLRPDAFPVQDWAPRDLHFAVRDPKALRACHLPKVTHCESVAYCVLLCLTSSRSVLVFQVHFRTVN